MMKKAFLILAAFALIRCADEKVNVNECGTLATVRDLTGLDGCGFVFELADGKRLIPEIIGFCGTPPLPDNLPENVLGNFQWVDGKKVWLDYEELEDRVTVCMAGTVVRVTCITEARQQWEL